MRRGLRAGIGWGAGLPLGLLLAAVLLLALMAAGAAFYELLERRRGGTR
jgi:hypothetical protein